MKIRLIGYLFWLIIIAIIIIFSFRCGRSCNRKKVKESEVIVTHDTLWTEQKRDTFYKPSLIKVVQVERPVYKLDTLYIENLKDVDTAVILRDYFSKAIYSDTQRVQYGKVIINDTVTQNRIAGRRLITDLNIPTITTTITKPESKRNQIYFGVNGMTDIKQNVYLGFSGLLKNKHNAIWEAGALYGNDKRLYIFGSRKFLITFKK